MKNFKALIVFLFAGAGTAKAGTVHTAVRNGALNQEWTYGSLSGADLRAEEARLK